MSMNVSPTPGAGGPTADATRSMGGARGSDGGPKRPDAPTRSRGDRTDAPRPEQADDGAKHLEDARERTAKGTAKVLADAVKGAADGIKELRAGAPAPGTVLPIPMPPAPMPPVAGTMPPAPAPPAAPMPDQSITPAQERELREVLEGHGIPDNEIDRIIEQVADGVPPFGSVGGLSQVPAPLVATSLQEQLQAGLETLEQLGVDVPAR